MEDSMDDYMDKKIKEYEEIGEDLIIWSNGITKRAIKDFSDEELKERINSIYNNTIINQNLKYSSMLEDVLLKRRNKRIRCIIKKLKASL